MRAAELQTLAEAEAGWWTQPHTFGHVASQGRWRAYRHLAYISRIITNAVLRGGGRLVVNLPPRHGKSQLISHWTPTWFLDNWPELSVMLASYNDAIATDFGRMVRNTVATNPLIRVRLRADSTSASRWHTPEGGGMVCAGVGGALTGRGGHLCIVDDPLKNIEDAYSPTMRRKQIEWFDSDFMSRLEPNATVVLLMHRFHPGDLSGYVLEEKADDGWRHIRLPAIAEAEDQMGRRPGEALCPERYNEEQLLRIAREVTDDIWQPRYQQNTSGSRRNRLYHTFTDDNLDGSIDWRRDLPVCITFDFNINPGMHVLLGQYDPRADLFTFIDEIFEPRLSLRDALPMIERKLKARDPTPGLPGAPRVRPLEVSIYGDATGENPTAQRGESSFSLMRAFFRDSGRAVSYKLPARNPAVMDRVNATVDAIRDMRGAKHVLVHPRCGRLVRDFREVRPDPEDVIDKSNASLTHASDAAGYWISYVRPAGGRLIIPRGRVRTLGESRPRVGGA